MRTSTRGRPGSLLNPPTKPALVLLLFCFEMALVSSTAHAQDNPTSARGAARVLQSFTPTWTRSLAEEARLAKKRRRWSIVGLTLSTWLGQLGPRLIAAAVVADCAFVPCGGNERSRIATGTVLSAGLLAGFTLSAVSIVRNNKRLNEIYGRSKAEARALRRTRIGTGAGIVLGTAGLGTMVITSLAVKFTISDEPSRPHTPATRAAIGIGGAALVGGIVWTAVSIARRRSIKDPTGKIPHPNSLARQWYSLESPPPRPAMLRF